MRHSVVVVVVLSARSAGPAGRLCASFSAAMTARKVTATVNQHANAVPKMMALPYVYICRADGSRQLTVASRPVINSGRFETAFLVPSLFHTLVWWRTQSAASSLLIFLILFWGFTAAAARNIAAAAAVTKVSAPVSISKTICWSVLDILHVQHIITWWMTE